MAVPGRPMREEGETLNVQDRQAKQTFTFANGSLDLVSTIGRKVRSIVFLSVILYHGVCQENPVLHVAWGQVGTGGGASGAPQPAVGACPVLGTSATAQTSFLRGTTGLSSACVTAAVQGER